MARLSLGDAAELAGDVGPDPRLIGVLAQLGAPIQLAALRENVTAALADLPVLQRRLIRRGRLPWDAFWQQVPVTVADHVIRRVADDPVATAWQLAGQPLDDQRPLWRLVLLENHDAPHLLFLAHHVLLDGASALQVVGRMFDLPLPSAVPLRPSRLRVPLGTLAGLNRGVTRTSLLTPITQGFHLDTVDVELAPLHRAAHACGATVNDAVLLAIAESLRSVARARGEHLGTVVASVPVSAPPAPGRPVRRNEVGAFVVALPQPDFGVGDAAMLAHVASRTRTRKYLARTFAGSVGMAGILSLLGALGWYRALMDRQRAITTLVTNLRGPTEPLRLLSATVLSLTPLSPALGNVTAVFAALSYAGTLRIAVRTDKTLWPDADLLIVSLRAALERISHLSSTTGSTGRFSESAS